MSHVYGISLILASSLGLATSQTPTEASITWADIWDAQTVVWIGLIAGIASFQLIVLALCCFCMFYCRRKGANESSTVGAPTNIPQHPQQMYQDPTPQIPQPQQQPVAYQQPQQPAYTSIHQQEPVGYNSRPTSVYYKNNSYRPPIRSSSSSYSTRPIVEQPRTVYR